MNEEFNIVDKALERINEFNIQSNPFLEEEILYKIKNSKNNNKISIYGFCSLIVILAFITVTFVVLFASSQNNIELISRNEYLNSIANYYSICNFLN